MTSSTALSQSLHHITATKLTALSNQRDAFEAEKRLILGAVASESNRSKKVQLLLDWFSKREKKEGLDVIPTTNVQRFLDQSRHDSSVSRKLLEEWKAAFERALDIQSRKYQHASLFGKLVTEWLENPNDAISGSQALAGVDSDTASQDSFEQVGRAEMQKQRAEWERIIFNPGEESKPHAIKEYLINLFGSTSKAKKLSKTPLEDLKAHMTDWLEIGQFTPEVVDQCIKGLLKVDLLSREKRNAITELQNNRLVLVELADVLNMELDALESWSWGASPIPLQLRRHLNGKYRFVMDEEILQALFLHFIGTKWAVHLKAVFKSFFHSGAWKQSSSKSLDRKARQRREGFLGSVAEREGSYNSTIRNERRSKYESNFFLTQLPSTVNEASRDYNDFDDERSDDAKSPVAIKQDMLHLMTTESLISTRLYGSFTIVQSDFRWFGPSLPHTTIYAVLEIFDVPEKWLKFFKKFLEAPVKFVHDGPNAQTQTRRSGVPVQHVLSDALGEAVLFCLDFAVNQATGTNLYRFHDDLWFWGQEEVAISAWKAIEDFTEVMGLSLNREKTGCVQITGPETESSAPSGNLPTGPVHWGFLTLNTSGKWIINNKEVDTHIEELRRQLSACKSILAWVQAWNTYVSKFFATNFGKPADCLGQQHIDIVISTFARIQRELFTTDRNSEDDNGGSAIDYLKRTIATRFHMTSLPDGFFYFPIELGGLDLQNPLIPLLLVHEAAYKSPAERIEHAFENEEIAYTKARQTYNDGAVPASKMRSAYIPSDDEPFMPLQEYTAHLEETSSDLCHAYRDLLVPPQPRNIEVTADVIAALEKLPANTESECAMHREWSEMTPYHQWVAQLYAGDVLQRFGGLGMGEKRWLPIGLAGMLRGERIRWQG